MKVSTQRLIKLCANHSISYILAPYSSPYSSPHSSPYSSSHSITHSSPGLKPQPWRPKPEGRRE